jgi:hypothetical protein
MRDLLLGITSAISIVAILETAGIINLLPDGSHQLSGYCDNSNRKPEVAKEGGGSGIAAEEAIRLMQEARKVITDDKMLMKGGYYLSKMALDNIFDHDITATGILIAPWFDKEKNMGILVTNSHSPNIVIQENAGFAYVIRTYCPNDCAGSIGSIVYP